MHEMAGASAVTPWSLATPPPQYQQDVPGPEALTTGDARPELTRAGTLFDHERAAAVEIRLLVGLFDDLNLDLHGLVLFLISNNR